MARAARLDDLGKTIAGRYVVEASLGGGGMGAVFKVRDLHLARHVALKRGFPTGRASAARKQQELLEREFHTLTQLAHPRIIEVYDYGVDEGGPYYTMELLDGADLHNTEPLPWRQACALLCDVASSLALLHARGLIHRDVSARNVRRTADGRAKLIDFGAMARMGVAKDVVGTPPFLAPEVLQMQALDGRVDLFSLGALGYYLLTGHHAFPARRFRDLRDAWRSRPAGLTRSQPELPSALNALILQLLSLDRGARPNSAAEVMQRLGTIAGLSLEEHTGVSRAYLTSPVLVGRDAPLVAVRRRMLSIARGDGGTITIHGGQGSGRSRMLDACALEAKLVGAAVLRADAADQAGDWGVARVLCAQLIQLMPEQATEAARLSRDVLSQVIDALRAEGHTSSVSTVPGDRSLLIRELRDFILALAAVQRLVIVVDDADRIDEPSAALLAALAHKTERHPLMLALAIDVEGGVGTSAALRLLELVADPIELVPLTAEQTETLLGSVFGRVPHLLVVASRIHALSQGNPRAIMELAQHLLDRNLARYEAGSWSLPHQLGERDLPDSLATALTGRLAALSEDARELCDALCVADGDGDALLLSHYVQLTVHRDARRVFTAIDELMLGRVVAGDSERGRVRFAQRGFVGVVERQMPEAKLRSLHGQLADLLASVGGDVLRRVHHMLHAGRDLAAVELLRTLDLRERAAPIPLLAAAVESAVRHGIPERDVRALRLALVQRSAFELDAEQFREHAPTLIAQLEHDAGLVRYRELGDLPEPERRERALADTRARLEALPEQARGSSVSDAIRLLSTLCATQSGLALASFDKGLLDTVPSLAPLSSLSPAIVLGEWGGLAHGHTLAGRYTQASELYQRMLDRLSEADGCGLAPEERARVRLGAHFVSGQLSASRGIASAEYHAQALEASRAHRVNAWRVRALYHLTLGDAEEAARCRRRSELTLLQEGGVQAYGGSIALSELICQVMIGDLIGVKQATEAVSKLAARLPGWQPHLAYGRASALLLQGDARGALDLIEPVLGRLVAGDHNAFSNLASVRLQALFELERYAEAWHSGREQLELCTRLGVTTAANTLEVAVALAAAKCGEHQIAVGLLDRAIESTRSAGQQGVCVGSIYEARARVASWARDQDEFGTFADLCALEYRHGRNPVLAARLARLQDEARQSDLVSPDSLQPSGRVSEHPIDSEFATIHSRMLECVDEGDRARCVLTMMLQAMDSFAGYLFGIDAGGHTLLAALPEDDIDAGVQRWFSRYIAQELDDAEPSDETGAVRAPFRYTDSRGRRFEPTFLTRPEGAQHRLAAVLVAHVARDTRRMPARELQQELAAQLIEHGDVSGRLLEAAGTQTQTR